MTPESSRRMPPGAPAAHASRHAGLSLIELMIAMTLGLLLIAAIASIFAGGNRSYKEGDRFARMEENGRFATKFLIEDLSMAGFWGIVSRPSAINITAFASTAAPCGLALDTTNPIALLHNPTDSSANSTYSCIATADFYAGGDVLAIKRVQGAAVAAPLAANINDVFLHTVNNPTTGNLIQYNGTPSTFTGTLYWRYTPQIYYIRKFSAANDGIPTLVRKTLNNSLQMVDEPLVEGIERFQVEFGIDDTVPKDGIPDRYVAAPTAAELVNAITARVYVLARSLDRDNIYTNTKTYNLGSTAVTVNDNFHRRVYASTVSLRNLVNVTMLP